VSMNSLMNLLRQFWLRRPLTKEERIILGAVHEKYGANPRDVLFFVREDKPLIPVRSSAVLQVWGSSGDGPWVHLTNLAGFMVGGHMTLEEIKTSQI
jgi:hypothetical protein